MTVTLVLTLLLSVLIGLSLGLLGRDACERGLRRGSTCGSAPLEHALLGEQLDGGIRVGAVGHRP